MSVLKMAEDPAGGHSTQEPAGVVGPLHCGRRRTNCRVSFAGGLVVLIKLTLALHHCSASALSLQQVHRGKCHCLRFVFVLFFSLQAQPAKMNIFA